jgi:hypothetical protein
MGHVGKDPFTLVCYIGENSLCMEVMPTHLCTLCMHFNLICDLNNLIRRSFSVVGVRVIELARPILGNLIVRWILIFV